MTLALFDLDNTLLSGDSDHAWGEFLIAQGVVAVEEYRQANDRFYSEYQLGTLDIHAYLSFALQPLTRFNRDQLTELHRSFMDSHIVPLLQPKAQALIEEHRVQGHTLMIITATNRFITEPIAKRLGIPHLLATEPEVVNERYTGAIVGTPCFQHGKVIRLRAWQQASGASLAGSYFYSDSANDIPLLELVDQPIAVDPDERLRTWALGRGAKIISLRS